MTSVTLTIEGMTCGHCSQAVNRAVAAVPGVTAVRVSLERNEAQVEGDADPAQLVLAVKDAGYKARVAGD
jgi:copper chaperone